MENKTRFLEDFPEFEQEFSGQGAPLLCMFEYFSKLWGVPLLQLNREGVSL